MRRYPAEPDPFPPPRLHVRVAAQTDRGLERDGNEDAAAFLDLAGARAFFAPAVHSLSASGGFAAFVCDGMGGEAGGEIASRLAVETISSSLLAASTPGELGERLAGELVASIESASARIKREARERPELARMGTTTTLAALEGGTLLCAQVGDSRAYLHREGELYQLTRDQTVAEMIRSSGLVSPDALGDVVGSNVILQAVGCSTRLDVALTRTVVGPGDVVLLCSDGLSGVVPDAIIAATIDAWDEPRMACRELIARALERGAPDNVTCVVFRIG